MTKVVYVGDNDEVEIPSLGVSCKKGESVDVDADVAERLLRQEENWQSAKAAKEGS